MAARTALPGSTGRFLLRHRGVVVDAALEALGRRRVPHYASAGEDAERRRLERLYDGLVDAAETHDVGKLLVYVRRLADERYRTGYDLGEIQTAFNVLEEAIWSVVLTDLTPTRYAEALGTVSTLVGMAKDALARRYVELATQTRAPALDLEALFSGTEGR